MHTSPPPLGFVFPHFLYLCIWVCVSLSTLSVTSFCFPSLYLLKKFPPLILFGKCRCAYVSTLNYRVVCHIPIYTFHFTILPLSYLCFLICPNLSFSSQFRFFIFIWFWFQYSSSYPSLNTCIISSTPPLRVVSDPLGLPLPLLIFLTASVFLFTYLSFLFACSPFGSP